MKLRRKHSQRTRPQNPEPAQPAFHPGEDAKALPNLSEDSPESRALLLAFAGLHYVNTLEALDACEATEFKDQAPIVDLFIEIDPDPDLTR